jgi:hypothetical protein
MSLDNLQVFYREATAVRTEVVAYLADAGTSGLELRGEIEGPLASHAKTLPLRMAFEAGRVGGTAVMSTVVLTETCFWEPGVPHWYNARVSLCRGDEVIGQCERMVGVRPLAVTPDGLRMNGGPHPLHAVSAAGISDEVRGLCLAGNMAIAVDELSEGELVMASECGLPLVVPVSGTASDVIAELRWLAQWPAVVLAIVDSTEQLPESLQLECPNMLLAENAVKGRPVADWAQLAIVASARDIEASQLSVPTITRRSDQAGGTLSERIAAAENFDPEEAARANGGQVVGCIV